MSFQDQVFWLKNKLTRRDAYRKYCECIEYQRTAKIMGGNSWALRKSLVEAAYAHCPFYHEYYDAAGFHPSMLQTEEDWKRVPFLEKRMIRENGMKLMSRNANPKRMGPSKTGGSTGKPLVVYKSKDVHFEVLAWRALSWYGVSPAMNEAIVHRRVPTTFIQKLANRLLWWPTRRAYLSATRMSDAEIGRFVGELKRKKIKWLVGYCGALEFVADYILKHGEDIHLKLVWSTSSPLTKIVRGKLEQAFHCPVMDQYGCCEMGNIAIQKPGEDCLTVNADYVYVDIVNGRTDITDSHETGDVCITDLHTVDFPLIKYRLGDRSRMIKTASESEDGFPKLDFVHGRISDMLYLKNGDCIDGSYLTTICDNYSEHISCYQIYQGSDYAITFRVVPKGNNAMPTIEKISGTLKSLVKGTVPIKTEIVDVIEDFAGKRKFIISEIALSKL